MPVIRNGSGRGPAGPEVEVAEERKQEEEEEGRLRREQESAAELRAIRDQVKHKRGSWRS